MVRIYPHRLDIAIGTESGTQSEEQDTAKNDHY